MTKKKRKNDKRLSLSAAMSRFLCFVLLMGVLSNTHLEAETAPPIPEREAPSIQTLERPNSFYETGEIIVYKVLVRWPSAGERIRMSPPELELENLELAGVGQESVSDQEGSSFLKPMEQILTFRFIAKEPGHASIKQFLLRWNEGEGESTHALSIPPIELTIKPRPKIFSLYHVLSGSLLGGCFIVALLVMFYRKRRKKLPAHPSRSLEEIILEKFQTSCNRWKHQGVDSIFLGELEHSLKEYVAQKLDWNPFEGSYNDLQNRAEMKWSKREASHLVDLFRALEEERFSGANRENQKLLELFQSLYSFVEGKKTL
ncbi:MAG: hypothetical protein HY584_04675 [Candidatus Omnitrophica bacterium]|nr:hypothetical protein [Candidatus Omnitrophota bacterium]